MWLSVLSCSMCCHQCVSAVPLLDLGVRNVQTACGTLVVSRPHAGGSGPGAAGPVGCRESPQTSRPARGRIRVTRTLPSGRDTPRRIPAAVFGRRSRLRRRRATATRSAANQPMEAPNNARALLSFLRHAARLEGSLIWSQKKQVLPFYTIFCHDIPKQVLKPIT